MIIQQWMDTSASNMSGARCQQAIGNCMLATGNGVTAAVEAYRLSEQLFQAVADENSRVSL